MPTIAEVSNPFEPQRDMLKVCVPAGYTPRQWVNRRFPEHGEFEFPTYLTVNGEERMRARWDEPLGADDCAVFIRLGQWAPLVKFVADYGMVFLSAASAVYSYILSELGTDVKEEAPSAYNLSGQRNVTKLGQAIPVPYGRNRLYPPYAARSYARFRDNDQYLYQLFFVGPGEYDIEGIFNGDTDVANFDEIEYAVYGPGDSVTMFPDNVVTSSEVGGIELKGPNETDYPGETGPFIANDAGTDASELEWDVVFPQGLFHTTRKGKIHATTVTCTFSYREIDDAGSPVGSWVAVPFSKTLASNTPQRFTVNVSVTPGRYEVKGVRTNDKSFNVRTTNLVQWYQLRAVLPSTKDYGDCTLLAVAAKATNNLNNQSQAQFNLIATRKLPIWNGATWSALTATRSIAWAAADILRANYGARVADAKIDLAKLIELDAIWASRTDYFDWNFDTQTTAFEALQLCLRVGRSRLIGNGAQFSFFRDAPQTLPVGAFSPENMAPGSFSYRMQMQPESGYDGIEVEYLDATTWKQEVTPPCLIGSDAGDNLERIVFHGCTERNRAYREGLYIRAKQVYQRQIASFKTGPEGANPSFGDLIAVSHDCCAWGLSGQVVEIDVDLRTVTLSQPIGDIEGNRIAFRDRLGAIDGPYVCSKVEGNEYQVVTTADIEGEFLFNANDEPPIFFFGSADRLYKRFVMTEKQSSGEDESHTITAVNYDERVYQFDTYVAEALLGDMLPPVIPELPTVTGLAIVIDVDTPTRATITWNAALGALYYVVELSYDDLVWTRLGTTNANQWITEAAEEVVYVRVAAIAAGQGAWAEASTTLGLSERVTSDSEPRILSDGDTRVST